MPNPAMALPGAPQIGDNRAQKARKQTMSANTSRKQAARKTTGGLADLIELGVPSPSDKSHRPLYRREMPRIILAVLVVVLRSASLLNSRGFKASSGKFAAGNYSANGIYIVVKNLPFYMRTPVKNRILGWSPLTQWSQKVTPWIRFWNRSSTTSPSLQE
ncbi:hypothetical protein FS749_004999, partial [Ceratobasidium sp. UAMH 11750]